MAGVTPIYGLRFQELGDPPHGPNLGGDLAADVETELQRIDADVTRVDDVAGAGEKFTAAAAAPFTGTIEVREGANGIVTAFGNLDVDTDLGGAWTATGITIPASLLPSSITGGSATSEIVQATNYYNGTNQYRYRIVAGGSLEFQHTGADGTYETLSAFWFKADA